MLMAWCPRGTPGKAAPWAPWDFSASPETLALASCPPGSAGVSIRRHCVPFRIPPLWLMLLVLKSPGLGCLSLWIPALV